MRGDRGIRKFQLNEGRLQAVTVIASAAKQSIAAKKVWIASSRSLSSGAHSRDPLAPRNDGRPIIYLCLTRVHAFGLDDGGRGGSSQKGDEGLGGLPLAAVWGGGGGA